MAKDLPYTVVSGKISDLFKKISEAKVPDTFSHAFLKDTLGLKSTNDRSLIGVLKSLGFLDASGKPTSRYRALKNNSTKGLVVAEGIKEAFGPIFEANENANTLPADALKGLIAQVSGTDKELTGRILATLNALLKEADFSQMNEGGEPKSGDNEKEDEQNPLPVVNQNNIRSATKGLNSEFHFNIQVHLPNNGTEETYLNIFNALREAFS